MHTNTHIAPRADRLLRLCGALVGLLAVLACDGQTPRDDYFDFLDRADRTPPPIDENDGDGIFLDPSGRWLFNIDLGGSGLGEVGLELTVTFEDFRYVDESQTSATVDAVFRFPDDAPDADPLARDDDLLISPDGRMTIQIPFTRLEPERSPIEDTAVETQFDLDTVILSDTEMCGSVIDDVSAVFSPIPLKLKGVTYFAQRYGPQGQQPVGIPDLCPAGTGGTPDAGLDVIDDVPDAGTDAPDDTTDDGGLRPPDIDVGPGVRADVSGRFWMSVGIAGSTLELNLIADLNYFESDSGAAVDGALRSTTSPDGSTALAVFTAPVDENGVFEVTVIGLTADSTLGPVSADVALRAVILDEDTFCGVADGTVRSPLTLPLEGTTFGVVRLPDGFALPTEVGPENAIRACP